MRGNQLADEPYLLASDLLAAVTKDELHVPERSKDAKRTQVRPSSASSARHVQRTPAGRCLGCPRVSRCQQNLQLVRLQGSRHLASLQPFRPPPKPALRQALLRQPEPLAIVGQHLDRRPSSIAKNVQPAGEGVGLQLLSAHSRYPFDLLAER